MDALSSMATIAGYKGVLLAANALPRMFPMLMTAAGTIAAARVFIVGAGVAGLQAIATARRLGAKVEAYDVRPAVKEQVQSLGARFVELPLEIGRRRRQGRLREGAGRVVLPPPARDDAQGRRRQRRRHHDRADPRQAGADPGHDRDGRSDGARIGRRRSRGRARRQLRADPARRDRRPPAASRSSGRRIRRRSCRTTPARCTRRTSPRSCCTCSARTARSSRRSRIDTEDEITRETLLTRDGDVVHRASSRSCCTEHVETCGCCSTDERAEQPFTFRILPGTIKTIGRAPRADFMVDAALVSRLHCRLTAGAPSSRSSIWRAPNGTFVNGERGSSARRPQEGDRLGVGAGDVRTVSQSATRALFQRTGSSASRGRWSSALRAPSTRTCHPES